MMSDDLAIIFRSKNRIKKASNALWLATFLCGIFMTIEIIGGYIAGSLAIMTDAAHLLTDVAGFLISLFALMVADLPPTRQLSFGFGRAEILGALLSVVIIWVLTGILIYEAVARGKKILNGTQETPVQGKIMFIVAVIGLVFNLVLLKIFEATGHGHNHGVQSHSHSMSFAHEHAHNGGEHGHENGSQHHHDHGTFDAEHAEKKRQIASQNNHGHGHKPEKMNLNISAAYAHALGDLFQSIGVCIAG